MPRPPSFMRDFGVMRTSCQILLGTGIWRDISHWYHYCKLTFSTEIQPRNVSNSTIERRFSRSCLKNGHRTPMPKYKLEYIWLDGYKPVPNLRGKTLVKEFASEPTLEQLPHWGFDGSSTP